jgi:hypothetical protein
MVSVTVTVTGGGAGSVLVTTTVAVDVWVSVCVNVTGGCNVDVTVDVSTDCDVEVADVPGIGVIRAGCAGWPLWTRAKAMAAASTAKPPATPATVLPLVPTFLVVSGLFVKRPSPPRKAIKINPSVEHRPGRTVDGTSRSFQVSSKADQ